MRQVNINEVQLTEIVKKIISEYDKQQREKVSKKRDRRLRNTDLLLRNYDNLLTHIDYAVEDEKRLGAEPEEVLEDIERETDVDSDEEYEGIYIGAIKRTKTRTRIIVKHIETALEFYKQKSLKDKISLRRYNVVCKYYKEKKKIADIAEELSVDDRTIQRDLSRAKEELSVLFFGIDGIKFLI